MKKLLLLGAAGVGYVLGSKAGRERYEQIRSVARKVTNDPRVRARSQHVADVAKEKAKETAPVMKDKIAARVGHGSSHHHTGDQLNPDSLHFQEDPYPKNDLP